MTPAVLAAIDDPACPTVRVQVRHNLTAVVFGTPHESADGVVLVHTDQLGDDDEEFLETLTVNIASPKPTVASVCAYVSFARLAVVNGYGEYEPQECTLLGWTKLVYVVFDDTLQNAA